MKNEISHWSTMLDIIEAGLTRDSEKARNYSILLADRLEESGQKALAARIRRILQTTQTPRTSNGNSSAMLTSAQAAFAPVDPESRSAFIDEIAPNSSPPPILSPLANAEVHRFIELQRYADKFVSEGIPTPHSLLVYGPPGCGKSTTAQFIAHSLGLPLLVVRLDAVMSSFLGTTAKNLRTVFEHAARRASVLFLDEFDALAKMRDDTNEIGEIKRIVNSLIQNIDAHPRLYVIAATNHEHLLDPAIWRRFDSIIQLTLPGIDERMALLRYFLGKGEVEENDLRWVATVTEGCSGADLEQISVRARQEKVLNPNVPTIQFLIKEAWRRLEPNKLVAGRFVEDKAALVRFIDSRTGSRVPARTIEALTGISDSTVARLRHAERDTAVHG